MAYLESWHDLRKHYLTSSSRRYSSLSGRQRHLFSPNSPQSIRCPQVQQRVETLRVAASAWCMKNYPGWIHCLQHWEVRKTHPPSSKSPVPLWCSCCLQSRRNPHALMVAGSAYGMMYLLHIGQGHSLITKSQTHNTWLKLCDPAGEGIYYSAFCEHQVAHVAIHHVQFHYCAVYLWWTTTQTSLPHIDNQNLAWCLQRPSAAICWWMIELQTPPPSPVCLMEVFRYVFTSLEVVISCFRWIVSERIITGLNLVIYSGVSITKAVNTVQL